MPTTSQHSALQGTTVPAQTVCLPAVLNEDLISILGKPNFACAGLAKVLRQGGHVIAQRAEHEQAAVILFLLQHYLASPRDWSQNAGASLTEMLDQAQKGGA